MYDMELGIHMAMIFFLALAFIMDCKHLGKLEQVDKPF